MFFSRNCNVCGRAKNNCACCPNCRQAICVCLCANCHQAMDTCICCDICGQTICEHKGNLAIKKNGTRQPAPAAAAMVPHSPLPTPLATAAANSSVEFESAQIAHTHNCPAFSDSAEECIPTCPVVQIHARKKTRHDKLNTENADKAKKFYNQHLQAKGMVGWSALFAASRSAKLRAAEIAQQQNTAATTIQTNVRGLLAKKKLLGLRNADRERKTAALQKIELSIVTIDSATKFLKAELQNLQEPQNIAERENAIAHLTLADRNIGHSLTPADREKFAKLKHTHTLPLDFQKYIQFNEQYLLGLARKLCENVALSEQDITHLQQAAVFYKNETKMKDKDGGCDGLTLQQKQNCFTLCGHINEFYGREVISLTTPPASPAIAMAAMNPHMQVEASPTPYKLSDSEVIRTEIPQLQRELSALITRYEARHPAMPLLSAINAYATFVVEQAQSIPQDQLSGILTSIDDTFVEYKDFQLSQNNPPAVASANINRLTSMFRGIATGAAGIFSPRPQPQVVAPDPVITIYNRFRALMLRLGA